MKKEGIVRKEEFSIFDWAAFTIGIVVLGFILIILIWPLIDPTPDRSANIQDNLDALKQSNVQGN